MAMHMLITYLLLCCWISLSWFALCSVMGRGARGISVWACGSWASELRSPLAPSLPAVPGRLVEAAWVFWEELLWCYCPGTPLGVLHNLGHEISGIKRSVVNKNCILQLFPYLENWSEIEQYPRLWKATWTIFCSSHYWCTVNLVIDHKLPHKRIPIGVCVYVAQLLYPAIAPSSDPFSWHCFIVASRTLLLAGLLSC